MSRRRGWVAAGWLVVATVWFLGLTPSAHAGSNADDQVIRHWQIQWIESDRESTSSRPSEDGAWLEANADHPLTDLPKGANGAWVRLTVPPTDGWSRPGLLVQRLYGRDLAVYENGELVYKAKRDFAFDLNKMLVPLSPASRATEYDIRILTTGHRAGMISPIRIGDFAGLSERYVRKDLPDVLLGTCISFLALIMLVCSGYLNRKQRKSWISLCLIALSTGTLIIGYSPLPYLIFKEYGSWLLVLFDLALFTLFPALSYYIDWVFEGKVRLFARYRKFQIAYSIFCTLVMIVYHIVGERFYPVYHLFTLVVLGVVILVQLNLIIAFSLRNAMSGNRDSLILSAGIFQLGLLGIIDLILYYASGTQYILFLWKIGVVLLILSLVIILARRIAADYATLLTYSKELELFNRELQRTEKLKVISDLAASVAHEVRNPLQVTRGFMQLLTERSDQKHQPLFTTAINELDRASGIITDFLTFAKPEIDQLESLDVREELTRIESMMTPLTTLHGGVLTLNASEGLAIKGNSSKFKQAFINLVKNSIEAIKQDGRIEIHAYSEGKFVCIRVADDGDGMNPDEVAKLGVPYFSTKTKGTGLGLTVTFRIIEAMQGTLEFRSEKGKGTEATVRFPLLS
ncbi:sensor histidine kinase [Cohnella zeiphila]|uniref:histidine kinase n=1 Tax=Cohnella zeiphila TaxID=2761120 RepID=A0A7X0SQP4_9BACL|nr:HAMP domain-containing sensor histidine kinase [Cohnella zeiphila]MBB6733170.1 HAMP domain-containing histidine kinase [Cohnella zeiphila]